MAEIIPGYFIHTPDEKFGPYANIMEADTAAEKLMSEGVQVLGITKEGFEGVVSFEALEYSAESFGAEWDGDNLKCGRCHEFEDFRYFEDVSLPVYVGKFCSTCAKEMQSASDEVGKYLGRAESFAADSSERCFACGCAGDGKGDNPGRNELIYCELCEDSWCDCCREPSCADKHEWYFCTRNAAESKLPPAEKAGITGVTSGATMEGLETLLAADEDACPVCEGDMDFDEAYRVYPYTLCYDCAGAVQDKRYDHAYSAEGELEETQEELAEVRTELSKSRTSMSMIRTGLAIAGFILLWEHHKWAKEEHDSKENRV